jgi:hypothetical protein
LLSNNFTIYLWYKLKCGDIYTEVMFERLLYEVLPIDDDGNVIEHYRKPFMIHGAAKEYGDEICYQLNYCERYEITPVEKHKI